MEPSCLTGLAQLPLLRSWGEPSPQCRWGAPFPSLLPSFACGSLYRCQDTRTGGRQGEGSPASPCGPGLASPKTQAGVAVGGTHCRRGSFPPHSLPGSEGRRQIFCLLSVTAPREGVGLCPPMEAPATPNPTKHHGMWAESPQISPYREPIQRIPKALCPRDPCLILHQTKFTFSHDWPF